MWEKMFRTKDIWVYRKRYKCPMCKEYTLHIIHDNACECEKMFCEINQMLNVEEIIQKDDYAGFYTSEELKDNFFNIEDEVNVILKELGFTKPGFSSSYDDKMNESLNILFHRCTEFDEKFTDVVINLKRKRIVKEGMKMDSLGYIINLFEDLHTFINLTCKDLSLFDFALSEVSRRFFSARFFMYNCIEHFSLAFDRIQVLIAILFDYPFKRDIHVDRNVNFEKYFKKQDSYKNSNIKPIYDKIKSLNEFRDIKNIRCFNDHDISYASREVMQQSSDNEYMRREYMEKNSNDVDKKIWLNKIPGLIKSLEIIYDLLDSLLGYFEDNYNKNYDNVIPLLDYFIQIENENLKVAIKDKKYDIDKFHKIDWLKKEYIFKLLELGNMYLLDVFFRIDEISHCINGIYNMRDEKKFCTYDGITIALIDNEYLIYSSLFRLYSCYDKIAKYLDQKYSLGIKYFNDITLLESNESPIKICKLILDNEYYKLLDVYRNDVFHNLRHGCLQGENGLNYHHAVIFVCLMENIDLIFTILQSITPISKEVISKRMFDRKVGRNDKCLCGSGIKYKFCCGKNI